MLNTREVATLVLPPLAAPIAAIPMHAWAQGTQSSRLVAAKLRRLIEVGHERHGGDRAAEVRLGPLRLDPRRACAAVGETVLTLTTGEFELLHLLASRPGEFVHRDSIARALRQPGAETAKRRSADMHVCRIRKKLRDAGATTLQVETVYGRGYCLRVEAEDGDPALAAFSLSRRTA